MHPALRVRTASDRRIIMLAPLSASGLCCVCACVYMCYVCVCVYVCVYVCVWCVS
jgi:hypothetical protein